MDGNNLKSECACNMAEAAFMDRAIALAWESAGHTRPNPPVGAVIVKNGKIIGEGRHIRCGADHAETAALKACKESPRGAMLYVTLEPCSRPGRVGACCDAIKAAGISRVVWACDDPNPVNGGRAKSILREAGIDFDYGLCHDLAQPLIAPFAKHISTGLPFVTVKLAMSLDGKIADETGTSRWISSPESLEWTGQLRERVDAIMVGAGTLRCDNPSLLCHTKRNDDLWRVVISKSGNLPRDSQIFNDEAKDRTLVFSSPREALDELGRRGFLHVLCEGGMELARSLAAEGLVDEWLTILSPIVIGHSPLNEAKRFRVGCIERSGADVACLVSRN